MKVQRAVTALQQGCGGESEDRREERVEGFLSLSALDGRGSVIVCHHRTSSLILSFSLTLLGPDKCVSQATVLHPYLWMRLEKDDFRIKENETVYSLTYFS